MFSPIVSDHIRWIFRVVNYVNLSSFIVMFVSISVCTILSLNVLENIFTNGMMLFGAIFLGYHSGSS